MNNDIDALKSRLDILDIAREYVRDLRRAGNSWAALCPFHEEKTPSFHLRPELGLYHCFGCQKGGDVINFYMEVEGLDFKQAVESLCERVGLPRPAWGARGGHLPAEAKLREQVQKALHLAAVLYAEALLMREDPAAERARRYCLDQRRLGRKTLQGYQVGYAPMSANWLMTTLVSKHGIEPGILAKAGLAAVSSRDGRYIDFFRGRIVFPVTDLHGKVCGFGGRILPDEIGGAPKKFEGVEGPKYLNSPDTPFFKKGDTLYGLAQHKQAIRQAGKVYIVEGYFDAVGLAQAGVALAASPMGGALTLSHAKTLARFAKTAVLVFDPDAAGIASAIRAGRILFSQGLEVRVLHLPSGLDPDEFVLAHGQEGFAELEASGSKSLIEFELDSYLAGRPLPKVALAERLGLARKMLATLAAMGGELEARDAAVRVAQLLRIDGVGLERELARVRQGSGSGPSSKRAATAPVSVSGHQPATLEESLLALAAIDAAKVRQALEQQGIAKEDFIDPRIAAFIWEGKPRPSPEQPDPAWTQIYSRAVLTHRQDLDSSNMQELLGDYCAEMRQRLLVRQRRSLKEAIRAEREAGRQCDPALLQQFQDLSKKLKAQPGLNVTKEEN